MSFQQALSGLNAASTQLDAIGNNVANANTIGFKQSRTEFSDVFANSLFGVSATAVGIGAQINSVAQQFTQGNVTSTSNPLDLAISGNGFFRMEETTGQIDYTRDGEFQIDRSGNIVNGSSKLTGYQTDANGVVIPGSLGPLVVNTTSLGAQATTTATLNLNLDSSQATPAIQFPGITVPTSAPDPNSYNYSTQFSAFDSLGNQHAVTLYFVSLGTQTTWNTTPQPLKWEVYAQFDTTTFKSQPPASTDTGAQDLQTLTFNSNGTMDTTTTSPVTFDVNGGSALSNGANDISVKVDLTPSTSFAGASGVNKEVVDGFADGRLTGIDIGTSGLVNARFSNGQTKGIGQVVLVNFANPQGMQNLGGNRWAETFTSGNPLVNKPGTGNAGSIQSAALEDSNVDLTTQLVNMITAQRFYQANAQSIKTQDQVLQTLLNI
jgi:flagellar hook protein FlgE